MAEIPRPLKGRYHFIGIGGIGMSGIARLFLSRGLEVSGSDLKPTKITEELQSAGAKIFIGHRRGNIRGAQAVVYSSAIRPDNPELMEAKKSGLALFKRAQALAGLMQDKSVITVSGSHGKTTTTSLISYMLLEAGLFPTAAIGGILKNTGTNACIGSGEFFVAEADESDGSFLYYRPKYSIITNIDREHLDYYGTFESEFETFRKFLGQTAAGGCVFCCGDDLNLRRMLEGYKNKRVTFGLGADSDIYAENLAFKGLSSEFDCLYKGRHIGRFSLNLGGRHNISNALAVVALGLELGVDLPVIKKALSGYKGARRRLEVKFNDGRLLVIDDYAHHPSEIKAVLSAAKELGARRTIAVFQPHRYTRTKLLLDEFASSFHDADCIVITDIYPAQEPPIPGIDSGVLFAKIKKRLPDKEIYYLPKEKILGHLSAVLKNGDLVLTLGAGDIVKVCDELVEKIKMQDSPAPAA